LLACAQSGSLDTTFDPGTGVDQPVYSIAVQSDGGILIGGVFTTFNGSPRTNIARLNTNGSLDSSFDPGSAVGTNFSYVNAVLAHPDGKILLGGSFTGDFATNLARLNTNGTLDASFNVQTDDTINALASQTNGGVALGGFFTEVNGAARSGIARLDLAAALDAGFSPILAGDPFSSVFALALQKDGKLVIGGTFTSVSSTAATNLARLNPDGSLDSTFRPGSITGGQLSSAVYAVAVDGQRRVLAAGDFSSANGAAHTNIVRFNPDGTVDPSFSAAANTDFAVNALVVQPDGKILIGGFFTLVNGVPRNYIARLNADGSLDATFDPGAGADAAIYALALQPDAKILIAGAFAKFEGVARSGIARLQNTLTTPATVLMNPAFSNGVFQAEVWTMNGKSYTLQFKNALSDTNWILLPAVTGDGGTKILTDPAPTTPQRFYRVQVN